MTLYNVHLYREMRLTFERIEADTPAAAAAIASEKLTEDADDIEDCNGQDFDALVDVIGDDQFEQSVTIDFEGERLRQAAPKLLEALRWLLDDLTDAEENRHPDTGVEYDSVANARAVLAEATGRAA